MIVFSCPECDTEMEIPDSKAGAKTTCPDCGERVQVPAAPKRSTKITTQKPGPKSTVVAKPGPRSPATSRTNPKAKRRPKDEDEDEDEDDDQPKKKSPALLLGIGGGLLAAAVAAGVVIWLMNSGKKETPEKKDPPQLVQNPNPNPTPPADKKPDDKTPPADRKPDDKTPPADKKPDDKTPPREKGVATGKDIYQHVLKSTAWIVVKVGENTMSGTGSLIDKKNRLILTNYHVVHGQEDIVVFFPIYKNNELVSERDAYLDQIKNRTIDVIHARVVEQDTRRDLALIQVEKVPDAALPLPVSGKSVSTGEDVYSVGNPGDSDALWVLARGNVRGVSNKEWKAGGHGFVLDLKARVVVTDSPTNPGDSGGPMVNTNGELVAVTQGGHTRAKGLNYFIDVSEATDFIQNTCAKQKLVWTREDRPLIVRSKAALSDLIKELESPDINVRRRAAEEVASLGPGGKPAVPSLVQLLKDQDAANRRLALDTLAKIGAPDKADVELLQSCLKHSQPQARIYAAEALGKIGPNARSACPTLLDAVKDTEAMVRQQAARSLGQVGGDSKETVCPVLKDVLKDPVKGVRVAAAESLARLSALGRADVPTIAGLLKHQDAEARVIAAQLLGNLGYVARQAIPALIEAAKQRADRDGRRAAISALARFGAEAKEAVPVLIDAMKDEELRPLATLALANIGPEAKPAAAALAAALLDPNMGTRACSLLALGKLGPAAKVAVPELIVLLKDKEKIMRLLALGVLGQVGKDAEEAIPELIKMLRGTPQRDPRTGLLNRTISYDKDIQMKTIEVLGKIGKPAIRPLVNAMDERVEPNLVVRLGAATALGAMGAEGVSARPALLIVARGDKDPRVRDAAAKAWQLVNIKPIKKKPPVQKPPPVKKK